MVSFAKPPLLAFGPQCPGSIKGWANCQNVTDPGMPQCIIEKNSSNPCFRIQACHLGFMIIHIHTFQGRVLCLNQA